MKEISHDNRRSAVQVVYSILRNGLPLESETALFVLASILDVMLTRHLLWHGTTADGHTRFVESNPLPRYFLDSWGLDGLWYFKLSLVAIVAVICQVIARSNLDTARRVMNFATLLVMGVVIYSVVLMVQHT